MNFGGMHQYYCMQCHISLPLCPIRLKLYSLVNWYTPASSLEFGGLALIGWGISQFHVFLWWIRRYAPVLLHAIPYLITIVSDSPQTLQSCWLIYILKFTKVWWSNSHWLRSIVVLCVFQLLIFEVHTSTTACSTISLRHHVQFTSNFADLLNDIHPQVHQSLVV